MSKDQIKFVSKTINLIFAFTIFICLLFSVGFMNEFYVALNSDYILITSESYPDMYRNILFPYILLSLVKVSWIKHINKKTIPNKSVTKEAIKVLFPFVILQSFILLPVYYHKSYTLEATAEKSPLFAISLFLPLVSLIVLFWYQKFKNLES